MSIRIVQTMHLWGFCQGRHYLGSFSEKLYCSVTSAMVPVVLIPHGFTSTIGGPFQSDHQATPLCRPKKRCRSYCGLESVLSEDSL